MRGPKIRNGGFTLVEIMIVVAIIGLLATIAVPNLLKARLRTQANACINNLRQIDYAIQTWAITTSQPASAALAADGSDILPYLGRGAGVLPTCPSDATGGAGTWATSYSVTTSGQPPTCLINGAGGTDPVHVLPQ